MNILEYRCAACGFLFRDDDPVFCPGCREWIEPIEVEHEEPPSNLRPSLLTLFGVLIAATIVGIFYIYVLRNP